ncbi:hypothetical protein CO670_15595 [Rhizobium sp. J15]|uniref:hypothetical protein n=1 Tax=Rhizobium sp. J15 TaxID=2035450 RepID=UPI000BE99048|nr:hypothetical protein [Rhizobium sp. J15]PDT15915.1 hypothetical protein CO670_15595 [Rhizobium sp. J15]
MSEELWCQKADREAAEKVAALLQKPMPSRDDMRDIEEFDPWDIFPIYGSYDSAFDEMAIEVLEELKAHSKKRDDLAAEMFREMLCKMNLCDYGTSPRVCFPTSNFEPLLPAFIEKWKAYSKMQWGD